jgi:predicted nucleotidyltransferase
MPDLGIIMPVMGMTKYDSRLSSVLFNKTRRGLLALLYGRTDESFYVNQIMQSLGSGSGAVQRELRLMTESGIVLRTRTGNMVYYQANAKCPIFNELKNIVRKTFGVADIIRESLATAADKIRVAFIFGSVAGSTDNRASDIDIMIIGDITFDEVSSAVSQAEETIQREINPVVYPVAEFRRKIKDNQHFLKTVLEDEKIFIIGDDGELTKLVK